MIEPHAHVWIDPTEHAAPIARAPYAPIVGPLRRQMKVGRLYVCRICDAVCRPTTLEPEVYRL